MWRLFITLYALLLAYILVIDVLRYKYVLKYHGAAVQEDLSRDSKSWLRALDHFTQEASIEELRDVLDEGNVGSNTPILVLSQKEFEQEYPQAIDQFNEFNQYWLDPDDFEFLYRMENKQTVLRFFFGKLTCGESW